jgi:hypothetical protein
MYKALEPKNSIATVNRLKLKNNNFAKEGTAVFLAIRFRVKKKVLS